MGACDEAHRAFDLPKNKATGTISPIFLTTTQNSEVSERVKEIREKCQEERREAELEGIDRKGVSGFLSQVMGTAEKGWTGWQKMSVAIDSGAAETVVPHTLITEYPVLPTELSKAGAYYATATGEPIPNLGEQRLPMATQEGSFRAMTFQAAPVAKPLGSVKRICAAGHVVIFDEDGSYILNKATGELNWLREESGNYMLDVWVPPPAYFSEDNGHLFGRQS